MERKVVILGASSEIGIEIMRLYLKKNFKIIAHYNKGNKNFFNFLKNRKIQKIKFNFLTKLENIDKFSKNKLFKNCDILINSLGRIKELNYKQISSKEIIDSFKVNLLPSIIFSKNLGFSMNKNGWGRIVNLGSIGTKFGGGEKNFPYSLGKFALEFFPSNNKKWIKNNVLINTVRVGVTKTKLHNKLKTKNLFKRVNLIPIQRMASPQEIAKVIFFLGSNENTFISNEVISISGGE